MRKKILLTIISGILLSANFLAQADQKADQKEESVKLFLQAAQVFQHPRCLNCHPAGEFPTQGNDLHPHAMNVQRGLDNHGAVGMKCATCHGSENNKFSGVPGAPKWGLAPKEMGWQGLSLRELCLRLKDKKRTHMTDEKFIKHNAEDKLVAWGWAPGAGRDPVPGTQKQFGEVIARWIGTGAECPN